MTTSALLRPHAIACAMLLHAACSNYSQAASELRVSMAARYSPTLEKPVVDWCADAARATAGRVRCRFVAQATPAQSRGYYAVRDRRLDLTVFAHAETPDRFQLSRIAELPMLGNHAETVSVGYQRIFERHPAMAAEHQGVKVLAVFTGSPSHLFSAQPITGLHMGMESTPADIRRLGTRPGYMLTVPGGLRNTSFALAMNQAAWEQLSGTDQDILQRLSGERAAIRLGLAWSQTNLIGLRDLATDGLAVSVPSHDLLLALHRHAQTQAEAWAMQAARRGVSRPKKVIGQLTAEIAKLESQE
jgi:TRAP-type C4-dicarboxylate transport system substrate-binding protein